MRFFAIAVCIIAAAAVSSVTAAAVSSVTVDQYDDLNNAIIRNAQLASQAHNAGNHAAAEQHIAAAERAFADAAALAPGEAQAYATAANFLLNTHRFDESIAQWDAALARVPAGNPARHQLADRARYTRFARASKGRDDAYAGGQGNLTAAVEWAERQRAAYPDHPEVSHFVGTVSIMQSEVDAALVEKALANFARAQEHGFVGWLAAKRALGHACAEGTAKHALERDVRAAARRASERGSEGAKAKAAVALVHESPPPPGAETLGAGSWHGQGPGAAPPGEAYYGTRGGDGDGGGSGDSGDGGGFLFAEEGWFVARFRNVALEGDDGLVSKAPRKGKARACRLYLPSAGNYADLRKNVQMKAVWQLPPGLGVPEQHAPWDDFNKGSYPNHGARLTRLNPGAGMRPMYGPARGPPPALAAAASVVSYACASYYHFVMEGLGRLLMLRPHLEARPELRLVVPEDRSRAQFITQFLALLGAPFDDAARRVAYDAEGGPNDARLRVKELLVADWPRVRQLGHRDVPPDAMHAVMPRSGLRMVRDFFRARVADADGAGEDAARPLVLWASREGAEMRQLDGAAALRGALAAALEARVPNAELRVFEGGRTKVADAVALFARAAAVVGVHGGALANVVFCAPSTAVVEIAPRSVQSWHYAHAAAALDLRYTRVHLEPDERGIAAQAVALSAANRARVVDAVVAGLLASDEDDVGEAGSLGGDGAGAAGSSNHRAEL